jgi:cobalt-zinc-cadmium efflux system protein
LNTFFAIIEIAGGLYANSVAILSDALHDLGDSLSLGLAWYFQRKSKKKRDPSFSYGYKRFSLLGACINSLVLVVGSIFIIIESLDRISNPQQPKVEWMIGLAVIGIAANLVAMVKLRRGGSINEEVVSLHFLEDVLGWVAVLIGSIVMMFADLPIIDPILSVLIAGFILFNVFRNLKSVFKILLQGVPEDVNVDEIKSRVMAVPGVLGVHDIHTWSMDGRYNILTLHVVANERASLSSLEELKKEVRRSLSHLKLHHITIEIESTEEECKLENC